MTEDIGNLDCVDLLELAGKMAEVSLRTLIGQDAESQKEQLELLDRMYARYNSTCTNEPEQQRLLSLGVFQFARLKNIVALKAAGKDDLVKTSLQGDRLPSLFVGIPAILDRNREYDSSSTDTFSKEWRHSSVTLYDMVFRKIPALEIMYEELNSMNTEEVFGHDALRMYLISRLRRRISRLVSALNLMISEDPVRIGDPVNVEGEKFISRFQRRLRDKAEGGLLPFDFQTPVSEVTTRIRKPSVLHFEKNNHVTSDMGNSLLKVLHSSFTVPLNTFLSRNSGKPLMEVHAVFYPGFVVNAENQFGMLHLGRVDLDKIIHDYSRNDEVYKIFGVASMTGFSSEFFNSGVKELSDESSIVFLVDIPGEKISSNAPEHFDLLYRQLFEFDIETGEEKISRVVERIRESPVNSIDLQTVESQYSMTREEAFEIFDRLENTDEFRLSEDRSRDTHEVGRYVLIRKEWN